MKTGRTIQELASELKRQEISKEDFVTDTDKLKFNVVESSALALPAAGSNPIDALLANVDTSNVIRDQADVAKSPSLVPVVEWSNGGIHRYGLTRHAHQQLATQVGIPWAYYDKLLADYPDLLATNVNHWFSQQPKGRLIRTLDGNIRAWLSRRYLCIDNWDMANAILPVLGSLGVTIQSCEVTPDRLYIKATDKNLRREITGSRQKGDIVEAGVVISNSEVGAGAVSVQPLVYRLVCTNGLIRPSNSFDAYRRNHSGKYLTGDGETHALVSDDTRRLEIAAILSGVADVTKASFSPEAFAKHVDAIEATTAREIKRPVAEAVQVVTKRFNLSEAEGASILDHLARGGDTSQWGLVNAVTRASQDVSDYTRATELEKLGGQLLEVNQIDWSAIADLPKAA